MTTAKPSGLKHFYIPEEQSVYLLSHADAKKLKDWVSLCISQLEQLGYSNITMIGKGAFGFVFGGIDRENHELVFKFSRITLPQHVQDRLEEEAFMLGQVRHTLVPALVEFQQIRRQAILVMQRAKGEDLEQVSLKKGPLPAAIICKIAVQMGEILLALRYTGDEGSEKIIVHGDIKPSNLVWDEDNQQVALIDWGSSVHAQLDAQGQYTANNVMDLMSGELQQTNARLGDVYFIGDDQLNGHLSSPRFDEQGLASTLYALASGQSSRFGRKVITPLSLGLPKMLADILNAMLSDDRKERELGGDYFFKHLRVLKNIVFAESKNTSSPVSPLLPTWVANEHKEIESVVYSSRKSFLREEDESISEQIKYLNDAQFDRYYKNYLQGMGETEKGFIAAVSRLGNYPVVGGMAIRWEVDGIYVDSSLQIYDQALKPAFDHAINNVVTLARAIHRKGIFKCCLFNAKDTLHFEREEAHTPFYPNDDTHIPYDVSSVSLPVDPNKNIERMHSYFEDGEDPDELLSLPKEIIAIIAQLNHIHHTGCIIFEALPTHLKLHNYYRLLDHAKKQDFEMLLDKLVALIPKIQGEGISGFMKLPYKDTRYFSHLAEQPERYYPRDPRQRKTNQR
ncbi:serine/threonine protein kinase [Alteromonas sediminis]|uniref:Serine/threonine protein kinase n=1 Tax=Alteromonas sediminis TaxID=2259342 RepID=A0A3N5Y8F9_9ALTE|nr:phosphotransferase [Alteromonas sediminis]RPJ67329.1 serine/threonine protein kinase [Alteromonas sediminis]